MMAFCVEPMGSGHDKSPVPLRTNKALAANTSIASGLGKYKENRHRAVIRRSLKAAAGPESKATTCFPLRMRDFRSKIHWEFAGLNLGPPMFFGMRKKQLIPQWKKKLKKALDEFLAFAIFSQLVYFVEPIRDGERHTIWVSLRFVPHLRHRITYFHQPSCHSMPLNSPPSGPITLRWRSRIVLVVRWRLKD